MPVSSISPLKGLLPLKSRGDTRPSYLGPGCHRTSFSAPLASPTFHLMLAMMFRESKKCCWWAATAQSFNQGSPTETYSHYLLQDLFYNSFLNPNETSMVVTIFVSSLFNTITLCCANRL